MSYGIIISLVAAGLSLIYGVMNNVNCSHGSFYMWGGFLTFLAVTSLRLPIVVAMLVALVAIFVMGVVFLYVLIPKRMRVTVDPDAQGTVMIMFLALAQVLQQGAFMIFGGNAIAVPPILAGNILAPGGVYVPSETVIAIALSIASYVGLFLFMRSTKNGKAIRAFSQDRELAEAMGVRVDTIALLTFGLGVCFAALSGSLLASLYSVESASGWNELVIAFVIVTFGGIGSISGSFLGGLVYGLAYSLTQYFFPVYSFIIPLSLIYVILILKPTGILGEIIERA